ncbi:hypothetical protein [Dyadobacter bucti]|uniref:hypothetical protein n=1 Tax=Dyadobacter bucti TaxID=2572203 RepID=UPI001408BC28|nr:hypothetical protein [Dyadobacter bucti]
MNNQNKPIRNVPSQAVSVKMPPGAEDLPATVQLAIAKEILYEMIMSNDPSIIFGDEQ